MVRWSVSLLAMIVLAAGAGAQQPAADPVIAAYKDYVAAQKNNDLAAAEAAAERAWRASEAQSGDGGKTAVLAFNLAIARLSLDHGAAAVEPARRAMALAEKGAAGVDKLQARLVLGEALIAENYPEAKKLLPSALSAAASGPADTRSSAYYASVAFGKAAAEKVEWEVSREAWAHAFDFADAAQGDVEMARADALIARGVTFVAQRKDVQAIEAFNLARIRLAPLAPERDDDKISVAEFAYAQALAWSSAAASRLISQERDSPVLGSHILPRDPKPPPSPQSAERPLLPGKPPLCNFGLVSMPRIVYPAGEVINFGVGGAVIHAKVDASGAIVSRKVVASVPSANFGEAVDRAKGEWTLKALEGSAAGCRFETSDLLLAVKFTFGN